MTETKMESDSISTEKEAVNYGSVSESHSSMEEETSPLLLTKHDIAEQPEEVPEYYATAPLWSRLVFGWISPLLMLGSCKDQLDSSDLDRFSLLPDDKTDSVTSVFEKEWEREKGRATQQTAELCTPVLPSLTRCLFKCFGRDLLRAGFLKLIHDILQFVGPQVLHGLILFLRDADAPIARGILLTSAVAFSQIIMSFCLRHYFFECFRAGMKARSAVVIAIYKKVLLLSAAERQARTAGEITNLMSIDAQRLQDITTTLHAVWYSFLQILLSIYFLWQQLGPSCLAGVAVITLTVPLSAGVAKWMGKLQTKLMQAKDRRVDVNIEVLGNMKAIKLQAWEKSFQDRIEDLRSLEIHQLFRYLLGRCVTFLLWSSVPLFVALATFAAYVLLGNELEVSSALTALALFEILRFPLFMLPNVINNILEASVALSRLQSFLLAAEYCPVKKGGLKDVGIKLENATFVYDSKKPKVITTVGVKGDKATLKELSDAKWEMQLLQSQLRDAEMNLEALLKNEKSTSTPGSTSVDDDTESPPDNVLSLRRINLEVFRGEFVVVVGAVGAGKSTLINSILGEVRPLSGTIEVNGEIAYYSQNPFIINGTVKDNIIFGNSTNSLNMSKYKTSIEACALSHDLAFLPNGELCEIGEKGITLSGGQKARVSLARACYHDADLFLLDDPLAAVDAHVGKHLFQKCIVDEIFLNKGTIWSKKTLKKRTVILVTNALQFLNDPSVDKIVVLKNGYAHEIGSYQDLMGREKASLLRKMMDSFHESMSEEDKTSTEESTKDDNVSYADFKPTAVSRLSSTNASLEHDYDSPKLAQRLPLTIYRKSKSLRTIKTAVPMYQVKSRSESQLFKNISSTQKSAKHLMTDEMKERAVGHVSAAIYLEWTRAAGGIIVGILILGAYGVVELISIASQWWLTYWSQHGGDGEGTGQLRFLLIYAVINLTAVAAEFFRLFLVAICGLHAAKKLFSEVLDVTLRAPMSFYDTTPLGRIVNRFSKDIYTVDEQLSTTLQTYLTTLFSVIGVIIVISSITPIFTLCLIPTIIFYTAQQDYFTKTYRELKRLDSVTRSPIYAIFGETLDGAAIIRAYTSQAYFLRRIVTMLDNQQTAYFLTFTAQCWLGIRLELVGTMVITFACLCSVLQHDSKGGDESFASLAGLSISFALSFTQALNWTVRMSCDLEANMVAVERINQYCKLESEAPRIMEHDGNLPVNWPVDGTIEFVGAKLRYRHGLPLVLKGLDILIPGSSKVGVVGRTGAGKSTLMVSLLRLAELDSGYIQIDGVDIWGIGLQKLRSSIAVIPQDPLLFSGSIMTNLDPFSYYEKDRLCDVLQRVGLMSSVEGSPGAVTSLTDSVSEGGLNFSVGQRQLIVIARALLSRSKIVIMDEATASVDANTDARIQRVMKTEFKDATCITVAHRLNTIMDSDYVLVMDDGRAAEFGPPSDLLSTDGLFKSLVSSSNEENK